MLILALAGVLGGNAHAHKPSMLLIDNADGSFTVAVIEAQPGIAVKLKPREGDALLWQGVLDENGSVDCPAFDQPYTVVLEAGHGAPLTHAGPMLRAEHRDSPARQAALKPREAKSGKAMAHDAHAHDHDHPPVHLAWAPPLSPSVDAEMRDLLEQRSITLKNDLGLIRRTGLLQCFQYHAQPHMDEVLQRVAEERAKGKKVELVTSDIGVCLCASSAFLATDFAIRELYGYHDVPCTDDLSIVSKAKMGGVWDALNLLFGREVPKDDASPAHTPEAFVFTAARRSSGKTITFRFADEYHEQLKRFFDIKKQPEKYPKGEIRRLKDSMVRDFLKRRARGDYGYFVPVKTGK